MQVSSVNSPSFTSVIPTKVVIDGREVVNPENVQKGCRKLIETLAGPIKNNQKAQSIAKKLAKIDKDYNYSTAMNGYACKVFENRKLVKKTASHFFRYINTGGRNFLVTGPQAEMLAKSGKELGLAKSAAKAADKTDTYEQYMAKRTYAELINKITNNKMFRVREGYDAATRKNTDRETFLTIFLKSNQKYGKKDFKLEVDTIEFNAFGK